ncbi:MAG: hypothetical protein CL946_06185 [Ectothiorhodospiraceae bacterium]|nr:hypothetical protein [Ectothiorhodospiraceae bacterium]
MDRKQITKRTLSDLERDYGYVPGTPEEQIAMVWPLTREACSLSKEYDAERRLQRHVVRIIRLKDDVD